MHLPNKHLKSALQIMQCDSLEVQLFSKLYFDEYLRQQRSEEKLLLK